MRQRSVILASQSPRRSALLEQAGIDFTIRVKPVAEVFPPGMPVTEAPAYIARNKAKAVEPLCLPEEVILAADTLVELEGQPLGKPRDGQEALEMLTRLSGKTHRVITGVCLSCGGKEKVFSEITAVTFRRLSEAQIRYYVDRYRPFDKAGAYAIQEWIGLIGVERIDGDYYNVMGLPVGRVAEELRAYR
ncbi:Maf family nucleotide pyrophosphatase [Compostibacter hankyongensis]|uniref:dTTP/UTP pyrophosphatase n=1 Tax=Compostibacter hankyongensis TaxID=1007089 RepID=A0ABP8FVY9_9BACT